MSKKLHNNSSQSTFSLVHMNILMRKVYSISKFEQVKACDCHLTKGPTCVPGILRNCFNSVSCKGFVMIKSIRMFKTRDECYIVSINREKMEISKYQYCITAL